MKSAFGETDFRTFQKSTFKQRARLPKCNNTSAVDTITWNYRIFNPGSNFLNPIAYNPSTPSNQNFYGEILQLEPYHKAQDETGYFPGISSPRWLTARSRGKWRVDFRLTTYFPVRPNAAAPGQQFIFVHLFRINLPYAGATTSGNAPARYRSITVGANHEAILTHGLPANSFVIQPALAKSNPSAVAATWAVDISSGPLVFEDYVIVPEVSEYCHPVFDTNWLYLTGSLIPFEALMDGAFQCVGLDIPSGYTLSGVRPGIAAPNLPGDWIIPAPSIFSGGPIPVTPASQSAVYPDFAGMLLAQLDFTATRIPHLKAMFKIEQIGFRNYRFTRLGIGTPSSYDWDWGDATAHGTTSPMTHVFPAAGTYNVKLTITNSLGESDSHTVPLTVA